MDCVTLVEDTQSLGQVTHVFHDGLVAGFERVANDAAVDVSYQTLVVDHVKCFVRERIVTRFVPVGVQSYNIWVVTEP
jgi:hypothetical protein